LNDSALIASLVEDTFWQRDDRFALVAFKPRPAEADLRQLDQECMAFVCKREHSHPQD